MIYFIYFNSLCGYSNGYSIKNINDSAINYIENFVQTQLEYRLSEKCNRWKTKLNVEDKKHFFGMYQDAIEEFEIVLGDRETVDTVVQYMNTLFQDHSLEDFSSLFAIPTAYKMSKSNTSKFPVGLFFGKMERRRSDMTFDADSMKANLFEKLKPILHNYEKKCNKLHAIDEDIIKIVKLDGGYRADIICIFCENHDNEMLQNRHAIHCLITSSSYRWIDSNYRRHLSKHASHLDPENTNQPSSTEELKLPSNTESVLHNIPDETLYQQFSEQSLSVTRAAMINNDVQKHMVMKIGETSFVLGIVPIKGDGNCLFASIAYQLKLAKINSSEHDINTIELRQQIVDHIQKDINKYKMAIKGTLYEKAEREGKIITDIDKSCEDFIQNELPIPGNWGGTETIMAVGEIFKVNVVIVPEKNQPYFPNGFNYKYTRSIYLAYRCSEFYNHYDSICNFEHDLLFRVATYLSRMLDVHV